MPGPRVSWKRPSLFGKLPVRWQQNECRSVTVLLPCISGAADTGDVDDRTLGATVDHFSCCLSATQKNTRQVNVNDSLPLCKRHTIDGFSMFCLNQ